MMSKTCILILSVFLLPITADRFTSMALPNDQLRNLQDPHTIVCIGSASSLLNAKMNAVLQISSRVFGKRAETAIKNSRAASCLADISSLNITELAIELRGAHFAKNNNGQVCLVIELDLRGNYGGNIINTSGEVWVVINAEAYPASVNNLTIYISFQYDHFELAFPIQELGQEIDSEVRAAIAPLMDTEIPIGLQAAFGREMVLQGEPELTIVGGTDQFSPTIAVGLEISGGSIIDRAHFRTSYNQNLLQPAFGYDWALQIESSLIRNKVAEEFLALDLKEIIKGWVRTKWKKVCWSGDCLGWDYHGWKDYINDHYGEHPIGHVLNLL